MKRFLSILLTAASLFALTSCSDRKELPLDENPPDSLWSRDEKIVWLDNDLNKDTKSDPNSKADDGNAFSKDFDGVLLTVTTDKAEYKLGEEIHFTASVKNNTDKLIALYGPTTTKEAHMDISTRFERDGRYLFDPDASWVCDCAVNRIPLAPGEEYIQTERRVTFIYKGGYMSRYDAEGSDDFEFAPLGEYKCGSSFCLFDDPEEQNSIGEYQTLDFSITVTEPNEPVEMYKLPPPEDNGKYSSHYASRVNFEAETPKSGCRPGETLTFEYRVQNLSDGEVELIGGFGSVFPHHEWGEVYPWASEEEIVDKQPLAEGIKVAPDCEFTGTASFTMPTEPGDYAVDFSADIRLSSGQIENYSLLFIRFNVSDED